VFFFTDPHPTEIYTLSLHDALPISSDPDLRRGEIIRSRARRRIGGAIHRTDPSWIGVRWRLGQSPLPFQGEADFQRHLPMGDVRSEEHTSELQSRGHLVCRLLLEKK